MFNSILKFRKDFSPVKSPNSDQKVGRPQTTGAQGGMKTTP